MNDSEPHYCWPDRAWCGRVTLQENVRLAKDTYRARFLCPDLAQRITPGQFLMVRLAHCQDPLLGRPLALYDTVLNDDGQPIGVDVVYLVLGKMTAQLARSPAGTPLEVWGPLGNGFATKPTQHLIMVAGGIGQTPFLALGRQYQGRRAYGEPLLPLVSADKVTFCYGVRTQDYLAGLDDFYALDIDVRLATDDGSSGHHGFVTEVLAKVLDENASTPLAPRVVCCGPEPMMAAVARLCQQRGASCEVSLETPMACGVGICFSCVAKVRTHDGWDYRRTCVEGPVFNAETLVFE